MCSTDISGVGSDAQQLHQRGIRTRKKKKHPASRVHQTWNKPLMRNGRVPPLSASGIEPLFQPPQLLKLMKIDG